METLRPTQKSVINESNGNDTELEKELEECDDNKEEIKIEEFVSEEEIQANLSLPQKEKELRDVMNDEQKILYDIVWHKLKDVVSRGVSTNKMEAVQRKLIEYLNANFFKRAVPTNAATNFLKALYFVSVDPNFFVLVDKMTSGSKSESYNARWQIQNRALKYSQAQTGEVKPKRIRGSYGNQEELPEEDADENKPFLIQEQNETEVIPSELKERQSILTQDLPKEVEQPQTRSPRIGRGSNFTRGTGGTEPYHGAGGPNSEFLCVKCNTKVNSTEKGHLWFSCRHCVHKQCVPEYYEKYQGYYCARCESEESIEQLETTKSEITPVYQCQTLAKSKEPPNLLDLVNDIRNGIYVDSSLSSVHKKAVEMQLGPQGYGPINGILRYIKSESYKDDLKDIRKAEDINAYRYRLGWFQKMGIQLGAYARTFNPWIVVDYEYAKTHGVTMDTLIKNKVTTFQMYHAMRIRQWGHLVALQLRFYHLVATYLRTELDRIQNYYQTDYQKVSKLPDFSYQKMIEAHLSVQEIARLGIQIEDLINMGFSLKNVPEFPGTVYEWSSLMGINKGHLAALRFNAALLCKPYTGIPEDTGIGWTRYDVLKAFGITKDEEEPFGFYYTPQEPQQEIPYESQHLLQREQFYAQQYPQQYPQQYVQQQYGSAYY